jgi:MoaA/NifB/PqqE/SkfB family radical SAM enzyme
MTTFPGPSNNATWVNGIIGYFLTKLDVLSAWLHVTNGCNPRCPYCYGETGR